MANKRIDELPVAGAVSATDLFETCQDPSGSKFHRKRTLQELADYINNVLGISVVNVTSELKAITSLSSSKIYLVLGDLTVDDGITRAYRYSSTDSTASDVGLLVLIPNVIVRPTTGSFLKITL